MLRRARRSAGNTAVADAEPVPDELRSIPGNAPEDYLGQLGGIIAKSDPQNDEKWDSEKFGAAASAKLAELAALIDEGKAITEFASPDIRVPVLGAPPSSIEGRLTNVARWSKIEATEADIEAFAAFFKALTIPGGHTKLKVTGIDPPATTLLRFHSGAPLKGETTASLRCVWDPGTMQVASIAIESLEKVAPSASGAVSFEDVTGQTFGDDPAFATQLARGTDHWRARLQVDFGIDVTASKESRSPT